MAGSQKFRKSEISLDTGVLLPYVTSIDLLQNNAFRDITNPIVTYYYWRNGFTRAAGMGVHYGETAPLLFERGGQKGNRCTYLTVS